jgi:uroporphyrin-III C-methyltransferase / precorrin-2 dehydrogenase / sirohydrochlorin ferrochelatase
MQYLPLFFDVRNKHCLIVGGGTIAYRKANLLHKAGACLHVVAPQITDELKWLAKQSGGLVFEREYHSEDLLNKMLVIAATDNENINQLVSDDAMVRHLPVNVVDNPALCSFILPSIVDRSPLMIAVSSGGASPVLARLLRARIETMIPAAYGRLAGFVGGLRGVVKDKINGDVQRRRFWENVLQGPVAEKVLAGKDAEARVLFDQYLHQAEEHLPGEVCLVGAGPGDPDLLTFKALRLLQSADVVLYDRLVADAIVDLARRDAEKIYVGKARSNHSVPQQEINQMLIGFAKEGKRVVRLKGGDPFIFGRGGEEIEGLAALNIPFQVVPGITAASGCASYAGIPLTHRDYAQSVRFVTGHLKDNSSNLPWSELVHNDQTVVFYMGLHSLAHICSELIAHGRAESTPIALIQKGTTAEQKVWTGTLATMPAIIAQEQVKAPTLIIVGEVVNLHQQLAWFSPQG